MYLKIPVASSDICSVTRSLGFFLYDLRPQKCGTKLLIHSPKLQRLHRWNPWRRHILPIVLVNVVKAMIFRMPDGNKSLFPTMLTCPWDFNDPIPICLTLLWKARDIKHDLNNYIFQFTFLEINGLNYVSCLSRQVCSLNEPDTHFYWDLCNTDQRTQRPQNISNKCA